MTLSRKTHSQKAWIILGLLAFGVVFLGAADANAQSSRDLQNRISRLENELETLNRAVYKGESPPPAAYSASGSSGTNMEVRLQELETQLRELQGKIEEQNYAIQQMKEQLERSLSDMELRLGEAQGGGMNDSGGARYAVPPQPQPQASSSSYSEDFTHEAENPDDYQDTSSSSGSGEGGFNWSSHGDSGRNSGGGQQLGTLSSSSSDNAAVAYEHAFSLLKSSQYTEASKEFEAFIAQNPKHALVPNAKYWLGESYYVRGEFETAARIFAEGYQQYPKGAKAADNLLKLGMSLSGMGNKEDACVALGQLEKDFSATAAPVMRRAKQEMSRLGCV
jgi:tol-pal system protein YbgF